MQAKNISTQHTTLKWPVIEIHPLAVLRRLIGKTQPQMATMLDCSAATIQSIEVRRLKLSEKLAQKISRRTDIHPGWLLKGDPLAPPVDTTGAPYAQETFERNQVIIHPPPVLRVDDWLSEICFQILGILASAHSRKELALCEFKVNEALQGLQNRFGYRDCSKMLGTDLMLRPEMRMRVHQVFTPVPKAESNDRRKRRSSSVAKKCAE